MERFSVFLSDWQVLFREGIHFTLCGEEDMEVIGETTDNKEALNLIADNPPKVAVLNINHDQLSGASATCRIHRNLPSVAVILVTDTDDAEHLFAALKCGASAYITKDIDPADLVTLIRNVAQGAQPISKALLKAEIALLAINEFEVFAAIGEQADGVFSRLSSTEADILRHISEKNSAEQVAQALSTSKEEISRHLEMVRSKLVNNDQSREVIEATQRGLPTMMTKLGKPAANYITRDEFNAFKESLGERLKSFIVNLD
jgi:DNA-binding NarL/FixJ family response regulator